MKVRYVDGYGIRNTLDPNFDIVDRRHLDGFSPTFYIPKDEIWIDHRFRDEAPFLLNLLRLRNSRRLTHLSYPKLRKELARRLTEKGPIPPFSRRHIRVRGVLIRFVDGSVIRRFLDPEFILGGHGYIYTYVPRAEIWLDDLQDPRELRYTLFHEYAERVLMQAGVNYDNAHDLAISFEKALRRRDGVGRYPEDTPAPTPRGLVRVDAITVAALAESRDADSRASGGLAR